MIDIQLSIIGFYSSLIEEFLKGKIDSSAFAHLICSPLHQLFVSITSLPQFHMTTEDIIQGKSGLFIGEEPWGHLSRLMTTCNEFCDNPNCGHGKSSLCVKEPELRETAEKTLVALKKSLGHTD